MATVRKTIKKKVKTKTAKKTAKKTKGRKATVKSVFQEEYAAAILKREKRGTKLTPKVMENITLEVSKKMVQHATVYRANEIQREVTEFKKTVKNLTKKTIVTASQSKQLILPPNCRFSVNSLNHLIYIIEQPPQVRTFSVFLEDGELRHCRVSLPYVIFTISTSREQNKEKGKIINDNTVITCSFSNKPLQTFADPVCKPWFPNVYSDNVVCLGRDLYNQKEITPTEFVEQAINSFYETAFVGETTAWGGLKPPSPQVADWAKWEASTIENPLFALKIKWFDPKPLNELLGDMLQGRYGYNRDFNVGVERAFRQLVNKIKQRKQF